MRGSTRKPLGGAYKAVMSKLKGCRSPQSTPQCESITVRPELPVAPVTLAELSDVCSRLAENKVPGPDDIPNKALKVALKIRPDIFADTFHVCKREEVFPRIWKRQKLVLLPKLNKPPGEPSSYRPICLLDTTGKRLERVICSRLASIVEGRGALSIHQYGFKRACSTVDAINMVLELGRNAMASKK